jgi:hypothetical protein
MIFSVFWQKAWEGPACQDRSGFRKHINPALTSRALLAKRRNESVGMIVWVFL